MVLIMGDFNGHSGNSLGDEGKSEPNLPGLKSLDFANYFNTCPVNLINENVNWATRDILKLLLWETALYFRLYLSPKLFTEQYQISYINDDVDNTYLDI